MLQPRSFLLSLMIAVPVSAMQVPDSFVDATAERGLDHDHLAGFDKIGGSPNYVYDYAQSGVALGDADGDGDPDIVLLGGLQPTRMWRNDGVRFVDVTAMAGIEQGEFDRCAAWGDYDVDGDLDLYIGTLREGNGAMEGRGRLYRNDGAFQFTDVTDLAGVHGRGRTLLAMWYDVDRDGLLDLYTSEFIHTENAFYRNNGDGTFVEEAAALGLNWGGSTHAATFLDSDGDGTIDFFPGNDYQVEALVGYPLPIGDGQLVGPAAGADGAFLDVSAASAMGIQRGIMGLNWGDPDYDGDLDLYKTDISDNYLMLNRGWPTSGLKWTFGQVPFGIEAAFSPWHEAPGTVGFNSSWAALFFSADLDLWDDLLVTNGHVAGFKPGFSVIPRDEPNDFYWGNGPMAKFTHDTVGAGLYAEVDDRGLAAGDMDLDGDLDLFVTPTTEKTRYYENRIERDGQGWLQVVPRTQTSAAGGIGAMVRFTDSQGLPHTRALGIDAPTASQHEVLAHFGLGLEPSVDVAVEFPSGIMLSYPGVLPNTRMSAVEPKLFELSSRVLPIAAQAPTGVDRLTVDAWAHDSSGTPLGAGAAVQISAAGLSALGPVQSLGGNHFRREFQLPTSAMASRISFTFDGWQPLIHPRVHFRGGLSPLASVLAFHPPAVRAGTTDSFDVVVVPKDTTGMAIGAGLPLDIDVPGCTPLAATVDHGDGRYSREYQAPSTPGLYTGQVDIGGQVAQLPTILDAAGPASDRTHVLIGQPILAHAASDNEIRFLVTPLDRQLRRLGPEAQVDVELRVEPEDLVGPPPLAPPSWRQGSQGSVGGRPWCSPERRSGRPRAGLPESSG